MKVEDFYDKEKDNIIVKKGEFLDMYKALMCAFAEAYHKEQLRLNGVSNSSKPKKSKKETEVTPYAEWSKVLRNL